MRQRVEIPALVVRSSLARLPGSDSPRAWGYATRSSYAQPLRTNRRSLCGREPRPRAPNRFQQYLRYIAKLLQVKKVGKQTNIIEVVCQRESLNHGDAFILDAGTAIYVWKGDSCSPFEAQMANMVLSSI